MDPSFERIFEDLYNVQSGQDVPDRPRLLEASRFSSSETFARVRETIDDADRRLADQEGLRLRSDARFFLLINLTEMVARPIQMRTRSAPFSGPTAELGDILRGDLDLLLEDAARRHEERQRALGRGRIEPDREISGHSVVEALAANWTRLKLNSYRIWGER
jgi:hypothetical protein